MKRLTAMTAALLILAAGFTTDASARELQTRVGKRVQVVVVRSPCEGGPATSLAQIRSWLTKPLQHGKLEVGRQFKKRSNPRFAKRCPNKLLWMHRLYYRGTAKGKETIGIRFPDNGLTEWTVRVR